MAIEKRRFGRTGHMSSAVVFGAAALARADEALYRAKAEGRNRVITAKQRRAA